MKRIVTEVLKSMEDNVDVLILTAGFGNGHLTVADALRVDINHNYPDVRIEVIDFFELTKPKSFKKMYKKYENLVKYGSLAFNLYYYGKEKINLLKEFDTASYTIRQEFKKIIDCKKPKVIISTFPVCSGYVSKYKRNNRKIPLVTIMTDIVATNEWIYPNTDLYCVATERAKSLLIKKGINKNIIEVTGVPVRKMFYKDIEDYKIDVIKKISPSKKVISFLGGGFGLLPNNSKLYQWFNQLDNVHTIITTGNNKKLFKSLTKATSTYKNISVIGYTNKIHEIMKRSDLIIGKPGGITFFEAIVSNVPCIILKPKLGQEKENCKYIKHNKMGFIANNSKELKTIVLKVLSDNKILLDYKMRLKNFKKQTSMEPLIKKIGKWI
ncbi:MAG: MGDG synthase family glycosyltransferase [Eubacteriales bacterium]